MDAVHNYLTNFVGSDGTLRFETARPVLDAIGVNVMNLNLSALNMAAVIEQQPHMRFPIKITVAKDAGLKIKPEVNGKAAWILVPRDARALKEQEVARRGGDKLAVALVPARDAAAMVADISADLREQATEASEEMERTASELREIVPFAKTRDDVPARIAELRIVLSKCDKEAKHGLSAAQQLDNAVNKLRDVSHEKADPNELATVCEEVGLALIQTVGNTPVCDQAHEVLGRTSRLARGERARCIGRPQRFEPVRSILDLERDFVPSKELDIVLADRRNQTVDPGEYAEVLHACLLDRGQSERVNTPLVAEAPTEKRLKILAFHMVQNMAAERGTSNSATVLTTYFVARAFGATNLALPRVKVEPDKDKPHVDSWRVLDVLREAVALTKEVISEVRAKRVVQQEELLNQVAGAGEEVTRLPETPALAAPSVATSVQVGTPRR